MGNSLLLTVFAGVSVFVVGQCVLKLVLEPVVEMKNTMGKITALFLREQASIVNALCTADVIGEIKCLASELQARKQAIPGYKFWSFLLGLPSSEKLIDACRSLNSISYSVDSAADESDRHKNINDEMNSVSKNLGVIVAYTSA